MLPFEEELKEGYYIRTFDSKTPIDNSYGIEIKKIDG